MDDKELAKGDFQITSQGDREPYVPVATEEPLAAHVHKCSIKEGTKYQSTEVEYQFVLGFKLDEDEGRGQVYNGYYKMTFRDGVKHNLNTVVVPLLGKTMTQADAKELSEELTGKMCRIMLTHTKNDRLMVDKILKPGKGQKILESQDTSDTSEITEADLDAIFPGNEEV